MQPIWEIPVQFWWVNSSVNAIKLQKIINLQITKSKKELLKQEEKYIKQPQ